MTHSETWTHTWLMRIVEELAPTVDCLTPRETTHRVLAQCDRLSYHAGFTVPEPHVEEPTQVRPSLLVVQHRDAEGSAPTAPVHQPAAPTVRQACVEVLRAVWRAL